MTKANTNPGKWASRTPTRAQTTSMRVYLIAYTRSFNCRTPVESQTTLYACLTAARQTKKGERFYAGARACMCVRMGERKLMKFNVLVTKAAAAYLLVSICEF